MDDPISLVLDKPAYAAGDVIRGKVYLQVREPLYAEKMVVSVEGFEAVRYQPRHRPRRHDRQCFSCTTRQRLKEVYQPGTYRFDFEIPLAKKTPGLFTMRPYPSDKFGNTTATLTHRLVVVFRTGKESRDLEHRRPIIVHNALRDGPVRRVANIATDSLRYLWLLKVRKCTLVAGVDSDVFYSGETVPLACRIQNSSKMACREIVVRLIEDVSINVVGGNSIGINFSRIVRTEHFDGAKAGETLAAVLPFSLVARDGEYLVPSSTLPHSPMQVRYRLQVECAYPNAYMLKVELPIRIIGSSVGVHGKPASTKSKKDPIVELLDTALPPRAKTPSELTWTSLLSGGSSEPERERSSKASPQKSPTVTFAFECDYRWGDLDFKVKF